MKGGNKVLKRTFLPAALPLLLPTAFGISCHLLGSGVPSVKDRQPRPHLLCIRQEESQNQRRKLTNVGTTSTLGKVLKEQKTCHSKKEIARRKLQLWEPIQRFSVTRLALHPLGAFHGLYCVSYKLRDGPGLIVLQYVELEVTGLPSFFSRGLPKGVHHSFALIPVRNISLT
ncbi:LOW QUALITY PROTEIN: hypothetical protein Cgig2_002672 [Carnegiea gigantea]|uniref:Uncharacterized protein n=1 Tax=Carnegiea gigantea TaxID=171969 RepID=A0A9Q1K3D7_9CARY|nr:LOW QUALITY PROTEIN: hypothetical protein Cgig2_002672 [Carnegiea gigantea]